jgi:hypothetical protein
MSQGEEDERYYQVAAVFKQFGQPNAQFPKDLDLGALQDEQWRCQPSESSRSPFFFHCAEYTELQKHVAAMGGLGTVLKNMKAKAPPPLAFVLFDFSFVFIYLFILMMMMMKSNVGLCLLL